METRFDIVLFDGVCNLCNSSVDFVVRNEREDRLKFASLQSKFGEELLAQHWNGEIPDSIMFFNDGKLYSKSTAALKIATYLKSPYSYFKNLKYIPVRLRDIVYDFIARNRYSVFGKKETCRLATAEEKAKFLS